MVSGCAVSPLSQRAATFSTAVSATVVKMQSAYQLVETTYEDAAMATLVNQFDTKGFNPASIQPFIPDADMKARTDLMSALQQYATVLAEVSGSTEVTELDKESEALGTNLQALAKDAPLSALAKNANMESGAASAAVDALGRVLMERKTAKELPSILESAQKPIDTICTLLGQDIGTPEGTGLRNELRDKYAELIADQRTYILANETKMSPDEKRTEIAKLPQLVTAEKQGDATLEQTQKALEATGRDQRCADGDEEGQGRAGVPGAGLADGGAGAAAGRGVCGGERGGLEKTVEGERWRPILRFRPRFRRRKPRRRRCWTSFMRPTRSLWGIRRPSPMRSRR